MQFTRYSGGRTQTGLGRTNSEEGKMSAKSWLSVVLTGAAAVLGSVIGANTPAIAASDNNPRTYAGDYQGGSLPIGTFIAFQYGSFAHADAFVDGDSGALAAFRTCFGGPLAADP